MSRKKTIKMIKLDALCLFREGEIRDVPLRKIDCEEILQYLISYTEQER